MSPYAFSSKDIEQINARGISSEDIEIQLENFRKGIPHISLVDPATVGDGIIRLSEEEVVVYTDQFLAQLPQLQILKFVPASGVASRMFKSLFEFLNSEPEPPKADIEPEIAEIIEGIEKFAFIDDLKAILKTGGEELNQLIAQRDFREIISGIVLSGGLNYGQMPKGLIKFHRYDSESRTALEEHMVEGAEYCRGQNNIVNLHFTVSREHLDDFIDLMNLRQSSYEKRFGVKYNIEFSLQQSFTDTIAVDPGNIPFRLSDGSILFRPGGHGALLANLNELDADLIFVKNIDNVSPDHLKPLTYLYKKVLAGVLLEARKNTFRYIRILDSGDYRKLSEIESFLKNQLFTKLSAEDRNLEDDKKAALLRRMLNRPMRVCGMVKNAGEPGGGPFWARNRDGSVSLQIAELAQIDLNDRVQSGIAGRASHFNPVDLVCSTRDHKGNPFDLQQFTDPDTGLISEKSSDGRELKAQELPGLWNGSMSDWNTIFVEVPIETFNPVKTINDLLRPEHLA
jgi:hypothetical protein